MEFTDFPEPLTLGLYDQAISEYTELVGKRALAIYQTGNVGQPGVSDVDLIVVPVGAYYDNYAFFSRHRLPGKYRAVFRHHPFILPPRSAGILRYTTHRRLRLVHGRAVLSPPPEMDALENLWPLLLEDYFRYRLFTRRSLREGRLSVRFLLSKLGSIRIPFETLSRIRSASGLAETPACDSVAAGVALRRGWFESDRPHRETAEQAWDLLLQSFEELVLRLRDLLRLEEDEELSMVAHACLRGERDLPGIDRQAVLKRKQAFAAYLEELCRFGVFYGSLVSKTLFVRDFDGWKLKYRPAKPLRGVIRLKYGLEAMVRRNGEPVG